MRVAGIMSGTSLDGIDVAVVDIRGRNVELVKFRSWPYSDHLRQAILDVSNTTTTTAAIARLHFELGEQYARVAIRTGLKGVELIGCHGQTIYHESGVATLQIGEASVIAERTGVPVISDFRTADIAAGGKGAPLVPFVDYLMFRHPKRNRVALNIGGIANITAIPAGATAGQVKAFDTGPGNMVIDALAAEYMKGKQRYDRDGRLAAKGKVNRIALDALLADPYYRQKPPKTVGREQYGKEFVESLRQTGVEMLDLIATATALTAATVATGIRRFAGFTEGDLIVSGGGAHNPGIMRLFAALLPGFTIGTSSDYGMDVDAKEAIAFAILAHETRHGRPSNLPSATGARHPAVLGKASV
jgi:anhydro-N-acetylmuramic acid kinase